MGTELTKADTSVEWLESVMEELLDLGRARGNVSKQVRERLPTEPLPPGQQEEWNRQEETRKRKGGPEVWSPTRCPAPDTHPQSDYLDALGEKVSNNDDRASRVKLTAEMRAENAKRVMRIGRGSTLARGSEELPKMLTKPEEERESEEREVDTKVEEEFRPTDGLVRALGWIALDMP